jgi:hypothetical protein
MCLYPSLNSYRCLQHPYLFAEDIEPRGLSNQETHEKLIDGSTKLRLLKTLLPKLKARGHRVLLFSQVIIIIYLLHEFIAVSISSLLLWMLSRTSCQGKGTNSFVWCAFFKSKMFFHAAYYLLRMETLRVASDKKAWMNSTNLAQMYSYIC